METISYTPKGVCSRKIDIEVEDGIVKKVHFTGGCNGNTQGVSKLVEGMMFKTLLTDLRVSTATDVAHHVLLSLLRL